MMSVLPPAGKGTITRTGRCGHLLLLLVCAHTVSGSKAAHKKAIFIVILLVHSHITSLDHLNPLANVTLNHPRKLFWRRMHRRAAIGAQALDDIGRFE